MADPADQSLFTESQATPGTTGGESTLPNTTQNDELTTLLGSIKNERGEPKYKDVKEALNGLKHAQEYIPQLKTDLAAKETALASAQAQAERVAELQATIERLTTSSTSTQPTAVKGLTEAEIAELVNRTLTQKEQQAAAQSNQSMVVQSVKGAFGDKAEQIYDQKAQELGLTRIEMNTLAAKSPNAVLSMLGLKPSKDHVRALPAAHNTSAITPPTDTFIRRSSETVQIGATSQELQSEFGNAKKLVDELEKQGLSTYDLSDPKVYFKHFGK